MEYLDIKEEQLKQLFLTTGCNSNIYLYNNEDVLVKTFFMHKEERMKIIKSFSGIHYNSTNTFPDRIVRYNKEEVGYTCTYYKDAICFGENKIAQISHESRLKATLQVEDQMKFLHNNGYIINDVRLNNNMFSPNLNDGFMIDFEDMILEDNYKKKRSFYRFTSQNSENLPPSKWEDIKKQFICNLSLMFLYDLEYFTKVNDEWKLLECLKDFKEIYEFAKQLFSENKPLYFSEIKENLEDEEKVLDYQKKLKNFCIKKIG